MSADPVLMEQKLFLLLHLAVYQLIVHWATCALQILVVDEGHKICVLVEPYLKICAPITLLAALG